MKRREKVERRKEGNGIDMEEREGLVNEGEKGRSERGGGGLRWKGGR